MANEAVIVELLGDRGNVIDFTVADNTGIEKGTILKVSGARTGAKSAAGDVFAGIAASEKVSGDGQINLGLYTYGIFDLYTDGTTITPGELVKLSGANIVVGDVVEADIIAGKVVGKALEAATVETAATIEVLVGGQ